MEKDWEDLHVHLNMNIIGYDVIPIDEEFAKEVGLMKADLNTLLQSSDYISIHVPLIGFNLPSFRCRKNVYNEKDCKNYQYIKGWSC